MNDEKPMPKDLLILSESQLFRNASINASIDAFAKATGYSSHYITFIMLYDQWVGPCFGGSYIDDYKHGKKGQNDEEATEIFYRGIRTRLGKSRAELSDETIKECWNTMCTFPEEVTDAISEFVKAVAAHPNLVVLFVNESNPLQHAHNLKQVGTLLDPIKLRIYYANSYEAPYCFCKTKQEMAAQWVENTTDIDPRSTIISFHRDILSQNLLKGEGAHLAAALRDKRHNIKTTPQSDLAHLVTITLSPETSVKHLT
jgi:hypothetical protein